MGTHFLQSLNLHTLCVFFCGITVIEPSRRAMHPFLLHNIYVAFQQQQQQTNICGNNTQWRLHAAVACNNKQQ